MKKKQRMDEMLIEKGFAASGDEALRLIMAGVAIADDKRIDKAGELVSKDAVIRLKERLPYVSRGGLKLKQAVDTFKLDMKKALVMDIGASTGGFTDVALQEGADTVIAVDCGVAQLHNKLLADERVRSYENTNFKYFDFDNVGKYCDFIVTDVSFISLSKIIPHISDFCKNGSVFIPLIKPQFEAAKNQVEKGGVVRDKNVHNEVIKKVVKCAADTGFSLKSVIKSPILGAKGNTEYLAYFVFEPDLHNEANMDLIEKAVYDECCINS